MVFITGPRQVGKTFLAMELFKEFKNPTYLNYDNDDDRKIILKRTWRLNTDFIIFDEIHKMKNWKMYLKGIYDGKPENQAILVTGSSRLDTFRQSGKSLAGRYFHLRLNPFSVKELETVETPYNAVEKLNRRGGFPEPFLSASEEDAARWRNQYYTDLIREDIFDFSKIQEIKTMRLLLELLRYRVASPVSYSSLAGDLQISPNTVKKYIQILESLHIVFLVRPYHRQVSRSILKEPKLYFYDTGYIKGNEGVQLENTVAVCLLKYTEYLNDVKGEDNTLNYLKTKDGQEVDFVVARDNEVNYLLEVKLSEANLSKSLLYFARQFPQAKAFQLVHNLRQEESINGINLARAGAWLAQLDA